MNDITKIKLIQSVSFFVGAGGEIGLGVGAGMKGGLFAGIEANEEKGIINVIAYWALEFSISINVGANVIVGKVSFCNGIDVIQKFVESVTGISFFGYSLSFHASASAQATLGVGVGVSLDLATNTCFEINFGFGATASLKFTVGGKKWITRYLHQGEKILGASPGYAGGHGCISKNTIYRPEVDKDGKATRSGEKEIVNAGFIEATVKDNNGLFTYFDHKIVFKIGSEGTSTEWMFTDVTGDTYSNTAYLTGEHVTAYDSKHPEICMISWKKSVRRFKKINPDENSLDAYEKGNVIFLE